MATIDWRNVLDGMSLIKPIAGNYEVEPLQPPPRHRKAKANRAKTKQARASRKANRGRK
jgi:hypothetical protein